MALQLLPVFRVPSSILGCQEFLQRCLLPVSAPQGFKGPAHKGLQAACNSAFLPAEKVVAGIFKKMHPLAKVPHLFVADALSTAYSLPHPVQILPEAFGFPPQ